MPLIDLPKTPVRLRQGGLNDTRGSGAEIYLELVEIYNALHTLANNEEAKNYDETISNIERRLRLLELQDWDITNIINNLSSGGDIDYNGDYWILQVYSGGDRVVVYTDNFFTHLTGLTAEHSPYTTWYDLSVANNGIMCIAVGGLGGVIYRMRGNALNYQSRIHASTGTRYSQISSDGNYAFTLNPSAGNLQVFKLYLFSGRIYGQRIGHIRTGTSVYCMKLSPNGEYIAYCSGGNLYIHGVSDGNISYDVIDSIAVGWSSKTELGWSKDSNYLALLSNTAATAPKCFYFDGATISAVTVSGGVNQINHASDSYSFAVAWNPEIDVVCLGSDSGNYFQVYEIQAGPTFTNITSSAMLADAPSSRCLRIGWNRQGNKLITGQSSNNYKIYYFDLDNKLFTYMEEGRSAILYAPVSFTYSHVSAADEDTLLLDPPRKYVGWDPNGMNTGLWLQENTFQVEKNPALGDSPLHHTHHVRPINSGKYDVRFTAYRPEGTYGPILGIGQTWPPASSLGTAATEYAIWTWDNSVTNSVTRNNGSNTSQGNYGDMDPAQEIMMAVDFDAGKIWFGVDGTWFGSGDPENGTNPTYSGMSAGDYYLIANMYENAGVAKIIHPDNFVTPVTEGFTAGWPSYDEDEWTNHKLLELETNVG